MGSKGVEGEALSNPEQASASLSTWRADRLTAGARLKAAASWIAEHELWLVGLAIPPLVFPGLFPRVLVLSALVWIPVLWLCRWAARGYLTVHTPMDLPILGIVLMLPVSLYASADLSLSVPIIHKIILEIAIFYGIVNTVRSLGQIRWLAVLVLIGGLIISVLSLLGTRWSPTKVLSVPQIYEQLPRLIIPQLSKAGFSPNIVGGTLAMLFPITISFFLFGSKRIVKPFLGLALLVMGFALFLTQSRGAWIGLVVALLCMAIWRSRWFLLGIPVLVALILLIVQHFGLKPVVDFISATHSTATMASRSEVWQRAIYILQDFPYTGIGLGTFSRVGPILYPYFLAGPDADIPHAHNIFLQAGIDLGIPGLVAFTGMLAAFAFMAWEGVRLAKNSDFKPLAIGLFCGFIVYLTHGLFDSITAVSIKAGVVLWAFLGFTAALWRTLKTTPLK
ncbi:MAG TPA: hypothetical protein EYP19_00520 [Desulfobacterales bacterium]|nr:hypothetical protein [Desulfobacterales bacterium]